MNKNKNTREKKKYVRTYDTTQRKCGGRGQPNGNKLESAFYASAEPRDRGAKIFFLLSPPRSSSPAASIFTINLPANCSVTTPLSGLGVCWTVCVTGGGCLLLTTRSRANTKKQNQVTVSANQQKPVTITATSKKSR